METKKEELVDVKTESETAQESKETPNTESVDNKEIKKEKHDPLIDEFYSEIDEIKQEDFKSSSKEQLERLLRPGSTYFNLNPFQVLQIDPYASIEEIKRKYRKLSTYVHPDKNPNDKERAEIAFEAVNRAYKMLEDEKERKQCLEVVDEAREQVEKMLKEKRQNLKKELYLKALKERKSKHQEVEINDKDVKIDEDDPDKYRHAIYVMTCKLFADIARIKVRDQEKQAEEKKRKATEKADEDVKTKHKKEWDKNFEESRETRVNSWKTFVNKKVSTPSSSSMQSSSKSLDKLSGFRPPKHKPESR